MSAVFASYGIAFLQLYLAVAFAAEVLGGRIADRGEGGLGLESWRDVGFARHLCSCMLGRFVVGKSILSLVQSARGRKDYSQAGRNKFRF